MSFREFHHPCKIYKDLNLYLKTEIKVIFIPNEAWSTLNRNYHHQCKSEAEFKEFDPRLKYKPQLKYGWFHLKLYYFFQDLSRRSIETGFWQI